MMDGSRKPSGAIASGGVIPSSRRVRIVDVAPRDGLQNEPGTIPTADKARLVGLIADAGVDEVEVTSFVSPKWVPQLGDAAELCDLLARADAEAETPRLAHRSSPGRASPGRPVYSALVPNQRGMDGLLAANRAAAARLSPAPHSPFTRISPLIQKVALFTAASETFNQRNTSATIAESLERFAPVLCSAAGARLSVRVYISCAFGCPFEGEIKPESVARVTRSILELLAREYVTTEAHAHAQSHFMPSPTIEISLGDTIGVCTPEKLAGVARAIDRFDSPLARPWANCPGAELNLHLHDTFGHAAECVRAALELGVRSFDGSVAGLGGCPYAGTAGRRAPGNIATETLVQTVHACGYGTGVDSVRLGAASELAGALVRPGPHAG